MCFSIHLKKKKTYKETNRRLSNMDSDPDLMPAVLELVNILKDLPRNLSEQIEIEVRLGYIEEDDAGRGKFDPDISETYFKTIAKNLKSFSKWDSTLEKAKSTDYYQGDLRLTIDDKASRTCMRKIKLMDYDFVTGGCFDVRISVSQEIPVDPSHFDESKECKLTRQKTRRTHTIGAWNFDLTEVVSERDCLDRKTFEVEVELVDFWKTASQYNYNLGFIAHSTLIKVRQLVHMCEAPEGDTAFVLHSKHIRNAVVFPTQENALIPPLERDSIEVSPGSPRNTLK